MHSAALDRFDLTGTVAWVVGGSGHLGAASSRALAEHGAHVVIAGRDRDHSKAVVDDIIADGLSAETQMIDVGDADSVASAASSLMATHGRLDTCVNFAYGSSGASFGEITLEQWETGLRLSGTGAFVVAREAGARMTAGASIVQVASMYGLVAPDPANYPQGVGINPPDYGFAKAGVIQLVRYQAVVLGPQGIRVNAISPGPFPGPAARAIPGFQERLEARVPLHRVGEPHELTGAVVFLASNASSFVTGTNIVVDGGWTAW